MRAMIFAVLMTLAIPMTSRAADWLLAPSTYTHDPQTGQRVTQYAPPAPVLVTTRPDYVKSGYRHSRSSMNAGDGSDNQHIVEQWGRPVRPYGEWLYPYRPYSVPYQLWGAPYAGLGNPWAPYPYGPPRAGLGLPNGGFNAPPQPGAAQAWPDGQGEQPPPIPHDWGGASGPT